MFAVFLYPVHIIKTSMWLHAILGFCLLVWSYFVNVIVQILLFELKAFCLASHLCFSKYLLFCYFNIPTSCVAFFTSQSLQRRNLPRVLSSSPLSQFGIYVFLSHSDAFCCLCIAFIIFFFKSFVSVFCILSIFYYAYAQFNYLVVWPSIHSSNHSIDGRKSFGPEVRWFLCPIHRSLLFPNLTECLYFGSLFGFEWFYNL